MILGLLSGWLRLLSGSLFPESLMSKNVLVLWSHSSGYLHACLQELGKLVDVNGVLVEPGEAAPFSKSQSANCTYQTIWINPSDPASIERGLFFARQANPELCLISGWHHPFYMRFLANQLSDSCIKVICFDWQWHFTPRNLLKAAYGCFYRARFFDAAFVGGERQYQFAIRVGFKPERVYQGVFSGDAISIQPKPWAHRLNRVVFVGRLVASKGCADLVAAWSWLHAHALLPDDWMLDVLGVGPYANQFQNLTHCYLHGFVQPTQLVDVMTHGKILCAPSLDEPWGLQIHEAACAGLALLATDACGSAVHLVRPGFNGLILPGGQPKSLALSLKKLIDLDQPHLNKLQAYGARSEWLSRQFSPSLWAATVMEMMADLIHKVRA
ncbi:MAG: glycosyltransferase family 4 protein [Cyanobacteriota bacterium]